MSFFEILPFIFGAAAGGMFGGSSKGEQINIPPPPPPTTTIIQPTPPPRAPLTASQTAAVQRARATAGASKNTDFVLTNPSQRSKEETTNLIKRKTLLGG